VGHNSKCDGLAYTTELLAKHDNPSGPSSSSVARNAEEFPELNEQVLILVDLLFDLYSNVGVVGVPCRLNIRVSNASEFAEGLLQPVLLCNSCQIKSVSGVQSTNVSTTIDRKLIS
jgi:hypothetical protein